MPAVVLTFQPAPEHVRTARLVAVAVARRSSMDELRQDEVRLAVGELCSRAVRRCRETAAVGPVIVEIEDRGPVFEVTVCDAADLGEGEDEYIALALVRGLADSVEVVDGPGGTGGRVRVGWRREPPPAPV